MAKRVPTESGNPYHNEGNGQFTSPNDSSSPNENENDIKFRENYIQENEKRREKDKTISTPLFKSNGFKILKSLVKKFDGDCWDVNELFEGDTLAQLDKAGVDFIIQFPHKEELGCDLKTILPYEGKENNKITFPVLRYDPNAFDKKNNRKGKNVPGWLFKDYLFTSTYIFQFLKNQREVGDTFLCTKNEMRDFLDEEFFSRYNFTGGIVKYFRNLTKYLEKGMEKSKSNKPIKFADFDISYDNQGRISKLTKIFNGKKPENNLEFEANISYEGSFPKYSMNFRIDKNILKNNIRTQSLNLDKEENALNHLFGL